MHRGNVVLAGGLGKRGRHGGRRSWAELLDQFAPLRKRVLRGLASDLFRRMLTAHVSETSPAFFFEVTARLGWRLVATKAL